MRIQRRERWLITMFPRVKPQVADGVSLGYIVNKPTSLSDNEKSLGGPVFTSRPEHTACERKMVCQVKGILLWISEDIHSTHNHTYCGSQPV